MTNKEPLVMIPVHDWIWQKFKDAYPTRSKTKFDTDESLDKALMKVAHDWTCRAIQYYVDQGMEDPWRLVEAYEIALYCPGIQLKECVTNKGRERTWNITVPGEYPEYSVDAEGINELFHQLKAAEEYVATLKKEPCKHGTAREVIDEAMEIACNVPAMTVKKIAIPGYSSAPAWIISFKDNDYTAEARGAEHLLREVKEAKAFWEALQELEKKERADAVRIETEVEVSEELSIIYVDRLDQSAKRLLIGFIENLTISEAVFTLAESNTYPHIALGDLYGVYIQLMESLKKERAK